MYPWRYEMREEGPNTVVYVDGVPLTSRNNPLYIKLANIRHRCLNEGDKDYGRYGGRGVSIDPSFLEPYPLGFFNFCVALGCHPLDNIGSLQVDRVDNNGSYVPGNLRLVAPSVNCKNRGRRRQGPVNRPDVPYTVLAERTGLTHRALRPRVESGMPLEAFDCDFPRFDRADVTLPVASVKGPDCVDWPHVQAFTLNIPGCHMGCSFCFAKDLWEHPSNVMTWQEVRWVLESRHHMSDHAVVLGGADPLAQPIAKLRSSCRTLRKGGFRVAILATPRHPASLRKLLEEGLLDYVHMSLLTTDSKYPSRSDRLAKSSMTVLRDSGVEYMLNVTVTDRTRGEVAALESMAGETLHVTEALDL